MSLADTTSDDLKGKKVVITAGGTGGHIYPALAVAQVLHKLGADILWVGVRHRMEERIVPNYFPIQYIEVKPLRGRSLKEKLLNPLFLLKSLRQAKNILKTYKPNLVIAMGGFVCGPVGYMAHKLNIPLILQEQNAVAGWTNEILAKYAQRVLVAYPNAFKRKGLQTQLVGNPLRAVDFEIKKSTEVHKPIRCLVLGGSQGATYLNTIVANVLKDFVKQKQLQVWHQCGPSNDQITINAYHDVIDEVTIAPFLDNIYEAYQWADLIIARSGALTLSEIAQFGKPSILVPFPGAVGDHQRYNANFLVDLGASILLDQREVGQNEWQQALQSLIDNPGRLLTMGEQALKFSNPDATDKVVAVCKELLC